MVWCGWNTLLGSPSVCKSGSNALINISSFLVCFGFSKFTWLGGLSRSEETLRAALALAAPSDYSHLLFSAGITLETPRYVDLFGPLPAQILSVQVLTEGLSLMFLGWQVRGAGRMLLCCGWSCHRGRRGWFWLQPPWGILECTAELQLLCLRCVEQLPFLCSQQFGCFGLEGNCWEINFFLKPRRSLCCQSHR